MKNIMTLSRRGMLTDNQVLTAHTFMRNPNSYQLAPSFYRVAYDLIVKEEPLEEYEQKRGWSARSAKVVLGLILHAMQEIGGTHVERSEDESTDKEKLLWLTGNNDAATTADLCRRYGFTGNEARLFLIMHRATGVLDKQTMHNRLYADRIDEAPDTKIIDVIVCKIREKIKGTHWRVETAWGVGYQLVQTEVLDAEELSRDLPAYALHVEAGLSYRDIATRLNLGAASTALRMVRRVEAACNDNEEAAKQIETAARDYAAKHGG